MGGTDLINLSKPLIQIFFSFFFSRAYSYSGSLLALRARPKEIGEAGHVDSLTVVDDDVEAQRTHVTAQFRLTQLLLVSAVVGWREEI